MLAIRSLISAGGVKIEGDFYGHQEWTVVDALSDAITKNATPAQGARWPVLQVIEIDSIDDPSLQPFPLSSNSLAEYGKPVDISTLKFQDICVIAIELGIEGPFVGTKKEDVIAKIKSRQAENNKAAELNAPDVQALPTLVPSNTPIPALAPDIATPIVV